MRAHGGTGGSQEGRAGVIAGENGQARRRHSVFVQGHSRRRKPPPAGLEYPGQRGSVCRGYFAAQQSRERCRSHPSANGEFRASRRLSHRPSRHPVSNRRVCLWAQRAALTLVERGQDHYRFSIRGRRAQEEYRGALLHRGARRSSGIPEARWWE